MFLSSLFYFVLIYFFLQPLSAFFILFLFLFLFSITCSPFSEVFLYIILVCVTEIILVKQPLCFRLLIFAISLRKKGK